jgi:hypothetical protein
VTLPGLADAESQLAIPLLARGELLGVLAVESRSWVAYDAGDELFLEVVAGQVALALHDLLRGADEPGAPARPPVPPPPAPGVSHHFVYYPGDDCVFVDDRYLIRNLPGRILWKLLRAYVDDGRTEFSNRELRLDAALRLPPLRDNLESRLILLRRRLDERCPGVRMVPSGRGRFALDVRCALDLSETG